MSSVARGQPDGESFIDCMHVPSQRVVAPARFPDGRDKWGVFRLLRLSRLGLVPVGLEELEDCWGPPTFSTDG
eukprot:scaffold58739_cov39-Prasinocladus_malaysianus.AAC.1